MREYSKEMNQRALEAKEQAMREAQFAASMPPAPPSPTSDGSPSATVPSASTRRIDPAAALEDEDTKRNLITNEIQLFRDRFKDEETKMRNTEKERKDRYERERALQREKRAAEESGQNTKDKSPSSPPPPSSSRHSSNRRDRSSPNDDRHRSSSSRNNTSNSVRSRTNDRRSPPSSSRYDRRSPPRPYNRRSKTKSPVSRNYSNDADDEETLERKRQEKRLREKESRYREVRIKSILVVV